MPLDLDFSPLALLAMWAGGIALGTAVVARWRIVGPGYLWVAGGAAAVAGVFTVRWNVVAAIATVGLVAGVMASRRPGVASYLIGVGGLLYLAAATSETNPVLVVTGAVALGGTTCEMLLGHWYLVDPRLPRWALHRLDGAGIAGLVADAVVAVALGALTVPGSIRWVFVALAAVSVLMMTGVWFSLRERGYEGVMAATGLSYLSVLTALGAVAVARYLVA